MLVSCPKCESRYKLPDEKIRPTGTKVRCPRCQSAFHVYPEPAPEKLNPLTDPFKRRDPPPISEPAAEIQAKAVEEKPRIAPPAFTKKKTKPSFGKEITEVEGMPAASVTKRGDTPEDFSEDFMESAKTVVSSVPERTSSPQKKTPSPFKRSKTENRLRQSDISEATEFEQRASEDPADLAELSESTKDIKGEPALRPFGDATFAEIQVSGRSKGGRKWIMVTATVGIVATLLLLGINNFKNRRVAENAPTSASAPNATAPVTPVATKKASGWYRDDPAFYQDFLSQMATLPLAEQQKPENRSLIADALISNGILTNTDDQVISGIGYASGLVAAYPTNIYGYYGLTTYAIWKEDIATLGDLTKRWPSERISDPEFKLAKIFIEGRGQNSRAALENLKALIGDYPHWYRAQLLSVLLSLEHPKDAEDIFEVQKLQEYLKVYEKRKSGLRSGGSVPTLYQSLDKRLGKKNFITSESSGKKKDSQKSEPKAKLSEERRAEPVAKQAPAAETTSAALNQKSEESFKRKQVTAADDPKPSHSKKGDTAKDHSSKKKEKPLASDKQKKALPKAAPDLIALNKQSNKSKVNAQNLFEQGNQKQKENKIDEAISLYQAALREDPDLAEVYKQLGVIFMNRQEKERSLRAFKIYLQLKPETQDRQVVEGWISSMQ